MLRVRLQGLKTHTYNHHIGTVQSDALLSEESDKRVEVCLAGAKTIKVLSKFVHPQEPRLSRYYPLNVVPELYAKRCLLAKFADDLVERILNSIRLPPVNMAHVGAVRCSSSHDSHEDDKFLRNMHGSLSREDGTWWISSGSTWRIHHAKDMKNSASEQDSGESEEAMEEAVVPERCIATCNDSSSRHFYVYLDDVKEDIDAFEEYVEYSFGGMRRCSTVSMRIPALPSGPLSARSFHLQVKNEDAVFCRVTDDFITIDTDQMQEFAIVPPLEMHCLRVVCTTNAAQAVGLRSIGFFDIAFS